MQQIDPIHNLGYNAKGHHYSGKPSRLKGKSSKWRKPIEALTFDAVELSGQQNESSEWLHAYIKSFPESVISERVKKFRDSFETIEDYLADKLIIDEL